MVLVYCSLFFLLFTTLYRNVSLSLFLNKVSLLSLVLNWGSSIDYVRIKGEGERVKPPIHFHCVFHAEREGRGSR